jgi:hypothetical protein
MKNEGKVVTIEKWFISNNKVCYWIVDSNGENLDGFYKKYQAIDAIQRWGMTRANTNVIVRKW